MYSLFVVLLLINTVLGHSNNVEETEIKNEQKIKTTDDKPPAPSTNKAVYLTNILQKGNYKKAQELARVHLPSSISCKSVLSYSGYFTVNKKYDSNLHMWYFVAENNPETAPVIFYLEAGPSLSVIYSIFTLGPLKINCQLELECREHHWAKKYHMVFIENPVDTGFSFTNSFQGLVKNSTDYTNDLYSAFQQFYQMFPNLKKNNLYLYSHSYGARYGAHLGERILKDDNNDVHLCGVIFGNPLINVVNQVDFGSFLYTLGLINSKEVKKMVLLQTKLKQQIKNKEYEKSFETFGKLVYIPDLSNTLMGNLTGYHSAYNFLYTIHDNTTERRSIEYVTRPKIRSAIHVEHTRKFILEDLENIKASGPDAMMSHIPPVLYMLKSNVTVIFYNGQLDMFAPYILTANVLKNMDEYGASYNESSRRKWYIRKDTCTDDMLEQWCYCEDNLAGYITEVKIFGKLVHALIRGGGHWTAQDQDIRTRGLFNLYVN